MTYKKIDNVVTLQSQGGEDQQIREIVRTFIEEWKDCPNEHFKIEKITGGVTNHLYKCSRQSEPSLQVLVRIYGNDTSLFIDRESELKILADLHQGNVGPKVYGAFGNGFVYEYLEGRTLAAEDVTEGTWYEEIGREIAKWHTMNHITGDQEVAAVTTNIKKWLKLIPESFGDHKKDDVLQQFPLSRLREESDKLIEEMDKLNSPIVFCHNDLFHGNMIVDDKIKQLKFIDYEYSGYNYRGFDLGALLAEWSGLDYKNYPSKEKQFKFFRSYLKAVNKREPTEKELQELYVETFKFSLVAHFAWGLWSLVQTAISDIDYDYLDYGKSRLEQYFANKDRLVQ